MFNIGDSKTKAFKVTEKNIIDFSEATGDKNPLHLDEEYAKKTIFKTRIAHGILTAGFISAVLGNDFPGPGTIYLKQSLEFLAPVKINDLVKITVTIIDINNKNHATLQTIAMIDTKQILRGEAIVILP